MKREWCPISHAVVAKIVSNGCFLLTLLLFGPQLASGLSELLGICFCASGGHQQPSKFGVEKDNHVVGNNESIEFNRLGVWNECLSVDASVSSDRGRRQLYVVCGVIDCDVGFKFLLAVCGQVLSVVVVVGELLVWACLGN